MIRSLQEVASAVMALKMFVFLHTIQICVLVDGATDIINGLMAKDMNSA